MSVYLGLTNDACNNKKVNNAQPENRKTTKKSNATSNNNLQWGVGKQTSPVRNEKKNNKPVSSAEVKKSVNANKNTNQNVDSVVDVSKSITTTKLNPRFTNAPINHRKTQRSTKRREGSSKIGELCQISFIYIILLRGSLYISPSASSGVWYNLKHDYKFEFSIPKSRRILM